MTLLSKFFTVTIVFTISLVLSSCSSDDDSSSDSSIPPILSVVLPAIINIENELDYELGGTCTGKGEDSTLTVTIGIFEVGVADCVDFFWELTGLDVSHISDNDRIPITVTEGENEAEGVVLKDTQRPIVSIVASAINGENYQSYSLSGSCSEDQRKVEVAVGELDNIEVGCVWDEAANEGMWQVANIALNSLIGEQVLITANMQDRAGNGAIQAEAQVVRDIVAPQVTLTTTDLNINKDTAENDLFSLAGTCSIGEGGVGIELGTLSLTAPCDPSGQWSLSSISVGDLTDGQDITLVITQEDSAENQGRVESALDKDTMPPTLGVSSSLVINIANESSYQLTGTCSDPGESVSITLGTLTARTTNCENDGTWTLPIESGLADNSYALAITQRDAYGNEGALAAGSVLLKDTTAPVFAINSGQNINAANERTYYVSGTCQEDGVLSVTVGDFEHNRGQL